MESPLNEGTTPGGNLKFRKNNIIAKEAIERDIFRAKVLKMEGVQGRREKNAGSKLTIDRKKRRSER